MVRRLALVSGLAIGLLAVSATTTMAHTLNVTISATCNCDYTVTATGNTDANASVTVDYSFTVRAHGIDSVVSGQILTNADANGDFNAEIAHISLQGVSCDDTVEFFPGDAKLTFNGTEETGFTVDVPTTLFCSTTPPPPGKTFDIGPSSMEGHLLIRPGDWVSGGYSFKFANGSHDAATVTVSSHLTLPFRCADGTTG